MKQYLKPCRHGPAILLLALSMGATVTYKSARADIAVALYYVDLSGLSIDSKYFACSDSTLAGPFMSAASAIEFREEVLSLHDGRIISHWSDEANVCQPPALYHDAAKGWYRGD